MEISPNKPTAHEKRGFFIMKHGSLFSGIGGFDLAAEWMGWENVFHCECNEFGQRILKHYWPKAISYDDITKTDFTIHNGTIDVITGGFPCQPFSSAGKRKGSDDERYLWHEMLRAIQQVQPTYVVAENVRGLLTINEGMVFEQVCLDLEAEGYEVQPILLAACAVNAPHRRDRIFIVAYRNHELSRTVTDTDSDKRCKGRVYKTKRKEAERHTCSCNAQSHEWNTWKNFPTQPPICSRDDGLSDRLDGITFPKWRNESIKGYGNAIVPSLVVEIFKAIQNTITTES